MRVFSFSETYGPFDCEIREGADCDGIAFDCLLTDQENNSLPEPTGAVVAKYRGRDE